MNDLVFSVSDFVAVFNQTIEYAYPSIAIVGELTNFRVSKNRWVYFDLKDEQASVKFFGTVYQLPGPLEDGLMLQVVGAPRLHPQFGFSVTVQSIRPVGEGSIKKAASLLQAKLRAEGLFDESRKRSLPFPPKRIGLITSGESAAYHDFIKILNERWSGIEIELADVQVQGERAPGQILAAIEYFNAHIAPVDVLIITRGGGSAEDLNAFNNEQLTRAVAASRVPTLVAIGHEIDISLAELAADKRASTPSNAAEILVPDKKNVLKELSSIKISMYDTVLSRIDERKQILRHKVISFNNQIGISLQSEQQNIKSKKQIMESFNPIDILKRGYAAIRKNNISIKSASDLLIGDTVDLQMKDGEVEASITKIYNIGEVNH